MKTTDTALVCDSEPAFAVPSTHRFSGAPPCNQRRKNADCATAGTIWNESSSICCQLGRNDAYRDSVEKTNVGLARNDSALWTSVCTDQPEHAAGCTGHKLRRRGGLGCWFTCLPMYTCSSS